MQKPSTNIRERNSMSPFIVMSVTTLRNDLIPYICRCEIKLTDGAVYCCYPLFI